jgi:hypothetical protein
VPNWKDFFIENSRVDQYLNERVDKWVIDKKLDFKLGLKSFKVYHIGWKGPIIYYNPFLSYILIPIKNDEWKVVKFFKRTTF